MIDLFSLRIYSLAVERRSPKPSALVRFQLDSLKSYIFAVDKLSVVTTIKRLLAYLSTLEAWDIWFKSRSHIPLSIVGQEVKTLPFHGSSTGSNPVRCIVDISTFTAAPSTAANGFFTVQSFLSDFFPVVTSESWTHGNLLKSGWRGRTRNALDV